MTSVSPLLEKVFELDNQIHFGDSYPFIISEKDFSKKEIEELRREHERTLKQDDLYFIANFLPDDIRPKDIPKL